ncbi:type I-E CRISPR-associated endoribonuclease Cas2e [Dermacoccus nishinomiyaensis]|uniref:type I-E CRISPR-associated endoribonuclease Cas2e n=1 Tax=Dermacoccus nishinomiyaensis TaxID=1274 RepID=UPI0013F441DC|nr:type I-E CRISPR-associated endoribonuclease Cas2e [Dermacoccus nishinomiyaensis]NHC32789.1 type I-E CRISPR-associated endoribonuclease Cas2 [Dermacoccus nishinomiyaensis]
MVVIVLTACPAGLRGHLTRWLLEISPGVFVGKVTSRLRDELWKQVLEECRSGKAFLVEPAQNEQGCRFRTHRHDWEPVDLDGVHFMLRPKEAPTSSGLRPGFSKAAQYRRARK